MHQVQRVYGQDTAALPLRREAVAVDRFLPKHLEIFRTGNPRVMQVKEGKVER